MCRYLSKILGKKTIVAVGASLFLWGLLLSFMATNPLPDTLKPGVYETINMFVPQLNQDEESDGRRRYRLLPVG